MRENSKMANFMAKDILFQSMGIIMRENIKMAESKDWGCIY